MSIITLDHVVEWLQSKEPETVICWDTFEPWHGLMEAYFEDQGYVHLTTRSEYDKSVEDSRFSQEKHPKRKIADYDRSLQLFNYSLHFSSLRYRPKARQLLEHFGRESWEIEPKGMLTYTPSFQEFNALMDSDARPKDVNWSHLEAIDFRGVEYKVGASLDYRDWSSPGRRGYYISIQAKEYDKNLRDLCYEINCKDLHPSTCWASCDYDGYKYLARSMGALAEGDSVRVYQFKDTLGIWERQGERLVRV